MIEVLIIPFNSIASIETCKKGLASDNVYNIEIFTNNKNYSIDFFNKNQYEQILTLIRQAYIYCKSEGIIEIINYKQSKNTCEKIIIKS